MSDLVRSATRSVTRAAVSAATDGAGGGFSPLSLFNANEQGAFYDPSDFGSMFQDSDGIVPVTAAGQPVSFLLDKRFGLRTTTEMMPSPATATLGTGVTLVGNAFRFTAAALNANAALTPLANVGLNTFYEVVFTVSNYVSGAARVAVYSDVEVAIAYIAGVTANGTYRAVVDPHGNGGGPNQQIQVQAIGASNNSFDVSNVTVRELPGNHIWTTTAAARPVLTQDSNGCYYLAGDGVDDGLTFSTLPAGLDFPFAIACAAQATGNTLGGIFGLRGGSPPYYEIQKTTVANQWRAFLRGMTADANNVETVGTNATPHVGLAEYTSSTANLRMDGVDANAASSHSNAVGTLTEIRIMRGSAGFFGGRFYGGVIRFGTLTTTQRSNLERWLGFKAGSPL